MLAQIMPTTLGFLSGTTALGIAFGVMFLVAAVGLAMSSVRRNSALLATCLVIVTLGVCGSGVAAAVWFFVSYR